MKAKQQQMNKDVNTEDVSAAIGEMRDSARHLISSVGSLTKNINWKKAAPAIIMTLVVMYGMRNRKILGSIVGTVLASGIAEKMTDRVKAAVAAM